MTTSSHVPLPARRVPRQARSEQRLEAILSTAADVIAERGYDAATLTEVAARVGTSIGSLYQYFPDKAAIASALAARYGHEIAKRWETAMADADTLEPEPLVDRLFALALKFLADRPAYLPLVTAAAAYRHDPADRDRLRQSMSALYQRRNAKISAEESDRAAEVTVQIVKAMNAAIVGVPEETAKMLTGDFRIALAAYVREKRL